MEIYSTTKRGNNIASPYHDRGMPQNLLESKMEYTEMHDIPNELENYHRSTLIDHNCEERIFEHELPYDNRAKVNSRLNLSRSGSKYGNEPDHSEQFLGEYYRDPNSVMYQPDMRSKNDQLKFRINRYKEWGIDADNSIQDMVKSNAQSIKDRRDAFAPYRMRLKTFSTSLSNSISKRFGINIAPTSQVDKYEVDAELGHSLTNHVANHTTIASNSYPVGWNQQTDHVWKVAEYGATPYSKMAISVSNQNKANHNFLNDQDPMVEFEGNVVPKSLVNLKKRHMKEIMLHDHKVGILPFERKVPIRQHVQQKQGVRAPDPIHMMSGGESVEAATYKQSAPNVSSEVPKIVSDMKRRLGEEGFNIRKMPRNAKIREMLNNENTNQKMGESSYVANYSNVAPVRVANHNIVHNMQFGDVKIAPNRKTVKFNDNVRVSDYSHKYGESHADAHKASGKREQRGVDQKLLKMDINFNNRDESSWRRSINPRQKKSVLIPANDMEDMSNSQTG